MSQTVQRPPTRPEQGGFNGAGKPPLEPQKKSVFPNWGLTAIATLILVGLLIAGVVLSQTLGAKPASSTETAPSTSSSTSETSNVPATSNTPVAGPTMKHQLYNAQAPAALQGSTVNVTLTVKELLLPIASGIVYHAWTFNGTVPGPVIRVKQGQTIHFTLAQEYVLVQSEFYTHQLSDGTYTVDPTKMTNGIPDYVVFNGYVNQYKTNPITAKAGQRIRIFLVNAGPTEFSAFHVIGALFSDTYADGNPANHMVGNQTVTIPPGGGMVVELTIPEAGLYPFVTHSFADVGKGAVGVLKVTP
jgi:FtsP/CotA-like multicopper oxidase with cupredoxin domain